MPTVVLFEGRSDILAFRAVARRRSVATDALELVDLGGITNLRRELARREGARVLGLYDAAEGGYVGGVLADAGIWRVRHPTPAPRDSSGSSATSRTR